MDVTRLARALGGALNIVEVEGCVTRVRIEVTNPSRVDDDAIRDMGALAVVRAGVIVQVVVGPNADALALDLEREVMAKKLVSY